MTRALICTGVLGGGTAVVFALALAVSILFPQGSLVPTTWNGGWARPVEVFGGPGFGNDVVVEDDVFIQAVPPVPDLAPPPEPLVEEG